MIRAKAVVNSFPNPEINVTTVEQQLKEMGIYDGPEVPRGADTVTVIPKAFSANLSSVFDVKTKTLTISGGPVPFTVRDDDNEDEIPYSAHWYKITVNVPSGFA